MENVRDFDKRSYRGGFRFMKEELIRTGILKHTTELERPVSDETLQALNAVQRTPWKINKRVLAVMRQAYLDKSEIAGIPYADSKPIPSKSDEEWELMSDEEKTEWRKFLSEIHGENARTESRRHGFVSRLKMAEELQDREAIWFPHFLDFRTRFYPMVQDLHPQGDDSTKALLCFAEGKRLGKRGLYWLGARLAACYGLDKLHPDERYQWALDNHEMIVDCARDPLDGSRAWAETDEEPWGFLATCFEWADAHELDNPEDYISHLPVQMDGSCNGLQHLSAMGRDPVGARATNVAANEKRQDIYLEVAKIVKELISQDAIEGNELAQQWVGRIDRKTVKRAVMTTPYGVTHRGLADQIVKDGHTKGMENGSKAAGYLRDKIVEALERTVVSAKTIMAWIQAVATELARAGVPFEFTTPAGNTIRQAYYNLNRQRVNTLLGKLVLWEPDPYGGISERKQTLASAPNVIHAFDAAHMVKTINRMTEQFGNVSFSMIHDSYGTHACMVDDLARTLREEFVKIYSEDWLQKIEDEVRARNPELNIPRYKEFVQLGDFDVTECLRSEFFFA